MRKLVGKLGKAIEGPFLQAITLCILFSAAFCHAQVTCSTPPTISSITPGAWTSGQTYNITILGTGFFGDQSPGCTNVALSIDVPTGSVTISDFTILSDSEIMATVMPDASDPAETGCLTLGGTSVLVVRNAVSNASSCTGTSTSAAATVQIVSCPTPTIASVSPSTWFAGKSYDNVVIKGTGFTTQDNATTDCPVTPVTITAADGSTVAVSGVTVVNKTKITATVAPPASDPTQSATITVGTATNSVTAPGQILGNQILCGGASMLCNGNVISTTDGTDAPVQSAIVGQPIILNSLPLPSGITTTSTWTVGGTNIGGYPIAVDSSSAAVTSTDLKSQDLTTYWIYPNESTPVTYQYCVNIQGATPVRQCSLTATAAFNVSGPSATILPTPNNWTVTDPFSACNNVRFLVFGSLFPNNTNCTRSPFVMGIKFEATGISNVPDSGGVFEWAQLLTKNIATGTSPGAVVPPADLGTGLDKSFPYPPDNPLDSPPNTTASDTPSLPIDTTLATEKRTTKATMYLLWKSKVDPTSIPVPLAYVVWRASGTVKINNWSLTQRPTTATPEASSDTGPNHGLPTWGNLATADAPVSTDDQEEDQ